MTGARRFWFALVVGLGGILALLSLGVWQIGRVGEKLAEIRMLEDRLSAPPLALGAIDLPPDQNYRRAEATGRFVDPDQQARMIFARKPHGPGSLYFSAFELESGERIMVQRGFAPEFTDIDLTPPEGRFRISGVLRTPREVGAFTPQPDPQARLVFARDVDPLAAMLDAQPILLVLDAAPTALDGAAPDARRFPEPALEKIDLPNNHLGYAVTWFSLAAIWTVMTGLLLRRRRG